MSKSKLFFIIGVVMLLVGLGFIFFALINPQASLPINVNILYVFYGLYLVIMIAMFILAIKNRK